MELKQYLAKNDIPVEEFAARIGCSVAMVYQAMSKRKRFGDETKLRIINETKGEVTLADLTLSDSELQREVSNG